MLLLRTPHYREFLPYSLLAVLAVKNAIISLKRGLDTGVNTCYIDLVDWLTGVYNNTMPITQQEIADRLKISRSLVARALSNATDSRVSDITRARILETARELGYTANDAARSLSTGKSYSVAFVYLNSPTLHRGQVQSNSMQTCATALSQLGYGLKINIFNHDSDTSAGLQKLVASRAADAIVLWGQEVDVEPQAKLLSSLGARFAVKGRHEVEHPDWPQVDFDHEGMMDIAARHLWGLGHRRIAYVGYRTPDVFAQRLLEGYCSSMEALSGAPPDCQLVAYVEPTPESAIENMKRWLAMPVHTRPTAAVIGSGEHAWIGIELELRRRGLLIGDTPGRFAVAGIGCTQQTTFFGQGHFFSSTDIGALGTAIVHHLLVPILDGREPPRRVVRLCPAMHLTHSHGLHEIKPMVMMGTTEEKICNEVI
ncbi:MAG TPA: LacI family DNA-binding transcriptional regulator [Capsulimonadaceae bacterium]|jgi:DNA-binding LacI/PurR family transcriptional regulator